MVSIIRGVTIASQIIAYSFAFILCHAWFVAYFNGDYVIVTINQYGEKFPELVLWIILVPIFAYGIYNGLKDWWHYLDERFVGKRVM
jgi:hypothetical protein